MGQSVIARGNSRCPAVHNASDVLGDWLVCDVLVCSVCKSMKSWLDSDPQHVAVVHCKVRGWQMGEGQGRGVMLATSHCREARAAPAV